MGGSRFRINLDTGFSWDKEAVSNSMDDQHRAEEGKVLRLIKYRYNFQTILFPSDLPALRSMASGETLLVYNFGKSILRAQGYHMFLSTDGSRSFSGMKVSKESKPDQVVGINYPDDYRVLKALSVISSEAAFLGTRQELTLASLFIKCSELNREYSEELKVSEMDKILAGEYFDEARELIELMHFPKKLSKEEAAEDEDYTKEVNYLNTLASNYKTLRYKFIQIWQDFNLVNTKNLAISNILSEGITPHEQELIDIDGLGGSARYIPKKEWFSQKIQDNVDMSLLSAFPDAEREIFSLFMGRTVAGRLGQVYTSGQKQRIIWRGMPVLIDTVGGIGKSTLAEKLTDTLKHFGYTFGNFPPNMNGNFGFGTVARSDFSYIDDCDSTLPAILESSTIKTLVANSANMTTHDKGEKHVSVKHPKCALMIITNKFELHKMNLDGGAISRIYPLKLWTRHDSPMLEFSERTGLRFEMNHAIEDMADRLGVDERAIMAYLLRLSLDRWVEIGNTTEMQKTLEGLLGKLRINLSVDHHRELMKKYLLVADRSGILHREFNATDFLKTIYFMSKNGYYDKSSHPYPWTSGIPQCANTPDQICATLTQLSQEKYSFKRVFKEFMESLSSSNGSNYQTHINFWSNLFYDCLPQVKSLTDPNDDEMCKHEGLIKDFVIESNKSMVAMRERFPQLKEAPDLTPEEVDSQKSKKDILKYTPGIYKELGNVLTQL